jgi:hypothetical protein
MALTTNFNQDPYYDDFSDNNNYYRVLFKPGNAVQARELTQLQTTLQDQIKKFGDHVFKTGSVVTGGQTIIQNTVYLNVSSTYTGQDISYLNFDKQVIINTANTKRAYVLKSYPAVSSNNEPITLIINQLYGDAFTSNESFYTSNTDPTVVTYYANTASANATGNCQSFSVNEGVFYYEGFFVKTQPQTVAINKYNRDGSSIVGFTVTEDLIDYSEDTTLLDPAQGSSNFQAPGADRYKIKMVLDTRPIGSADLKQFIELGTIEGGVPLKIVQTPIYAAIGDEFARRTEDESGDYVVKNFPIELSDSTANSAFANVALGSGKAYVKGYEFKRDAPTIISVPKPRTTESVSNRRIEIDFGYYVFANGLFGNFATNQYANVELSLLNTGQANAYLTGANSAIYANTHIGNTRIKLVSFYSTSSNTSESNNYIYKVFLTDINTKPIAANNGYGVNATGGTANSIAFPTGFAANNDVYKGLSVRIVGGTPFNSPGDNTSRIITDYVGSTLTANVSPPFSTAVTANFRFVIDTKFSDVESFVTRSLANVRIASANVSPLSKNESVGGPPTSIIQSKGLFQPVIISDSEQEPLLIKIGENNIADNTIRDFSYAYRRLYQSVAFTSGVSQSLSLATGETLQSASTTTAKQQYYQIVVTSPGTSFYVTGQTVPAQAFTVSTESRTISVDNGANMTANIYAIVNASNPTSKTKTFVPANTKLVDPAWGLGLGTYISIFGSSASGNINANIAPNDGQTIINQSLVERRPGLPQYLYVTDVHSINAIFDLSGANVTTSVYNSLTEASNVTSRYVLNTGQKDSYYEWSSISLKPGQNAPIGPLVIRYNRFTSNGSGYFDVDSYTRLGSQENGGRGIDYGLIPIYTTQDGAKTSLRDYLDFRPVRVDATTTIRANNFILNVNEAVLGPQIAEPGLDIITDYEYYLPRIDRVVLNKSREFRVLQGIPAVNPVVPVEPDDSMTLYVLTYPPYVSFATSIAIQTFNHRRYTMKDIARLDKRIQNLELYTSLSIAELATINKNDRTIRDSFGISRPKNGVFVDSFVDKSAADVVKPEFNAAIDIVSRLCRGSFNIASTRVFSNNSTSNQNVDINGPLMLLSSSNTSFVSQNRASKTMNINPFNIVNYIGTILLDPPSDVWRSETRLESQNIDLSGGQEARDAWSAISRTDYGNWNTQVVGVSQQVLEKTTKVDVVGHAQGQGWAIADRFENSGGVVQGGGGRAIRADVDFVETSKVLETQLLEKTRTNIVTTIVPNQLTQSFGDRLIDVSVVQYMRRRNILILGTKFKPFTTLNAFFDNINVNDKIAKINRFEMNVNDLRYQTTVSNAEAVTFYQATSNTALSSTDTEIGTGGVVLTSNNNAFIVSMLPTASFGSWSQCATNGIWVKGNITGNIYRAVNWYHQSGVALAGAASTITLAFSAGGATNASDYVGKTIRIIAGTGSGQSATISAYDSSTRVATITGTWTTNPDTTSVYTIGTLETTKEGATAAVFFCPPDVFRTGEKILRLIDDEFNNIENSRTNGDVKFYSQGQVDTKQEQIVTVFTPTVSRASVNEAVSETVSSIKTTTTTRRNNVVIGYYDPLAQTFLVNPNQYPQGIVIDSIRVCFKTKDFTAPVTCQIRPVNNGYPSSAVIYPYGEKTLTPDQVKITDNPDVTDPNKYTEFKFDVPVLLLPGEHSFVLVSNSNGYESYVAQIGGTDIRTSVKISEQPYTGSLFLSQNGSTWTADQELDIMFSIQKRVFTQNSGQAIFEVDLSPYSANTVFDTFQLMSTDATMLNTNISYDFFSETISGDTQPFLPVIPNLDYECVDGYGRRILSTTTGNNTFLVRTTLSSSNPDVSPMIDVTRLNLLTIENKINNLELQNTDFIITNQGSGYTTNGSVVFSYADGTVGQGSGGAARAVTDGNRIVRIELTNSGTGYITSPTLSITGGGGSGATAVYNGEDKASGGNSNVRYVTKRVKLAPGFEAGDLRVYMDVYRPPGSGVLVYYKLLSESDNADFDDNNYNLMTEFSTTLNFVSTSKNDFFEAVFAPGTYNSGVFNNRVRYTSANGSTYDDFALFAIKVVMFGTSTVNVPKISQLRVIALPAATV